MKISIMIIVVMLTMGCVDNRNIKGVMAGECVNAFAEWGVYAIEVSPKNLSGDKSYVVLVKHINGSV